MPEAIFSLPYFGPISFYSELIKYEEIMIEAAENYQKQTYRNRQYIYGANGRLMLNIPVKRGTSQKRQTYKDCEIENSFSWQSLHFKSLETAYRTSPYFEFYEADIEPLYQKTYQSLFEYNLVCLETVFNLLNKKPKLQFTESYKVEYNSVTDCRDLIRAKNSNYNIDAAYHQVFEDKHGFIPNLSILDVIFNLGLESLKYLQSINLSQP